jgi:hypothetical protein
MPVGVSWHGGDGGEAKLLQLLKKVSSLLPVLFLHDSSYQEHFTQYLKRNQYTFMLPLKVGAQGWQPLMLLLCCVTVARRQSESVLAGSNGDGSCSRFFYLIVLILKNICLCVPCPRPPQLGLKLSVSPGIDLRLFFFLPSHKITVLIIILFENYIVNPVQCMNVWLQSVKPSWD